MARARARRGLALLAVACLAAASLAACSRRPDAPRAAEPSPSLPPVPSPLPDPMPEVLATVNGKPIPLAHARIIVEQTFKGSTPSPAQRAAEYRRAVDQLVVRELIYQEAVARGIKPDAAAVDRLRLQVRSEHKSEADFDAFLKAQGLDAKSFLEELRIRTAVETLVKQEAEKVPPTISEDEARAYYAANPALFESAGRPLPFEEVRERIQSQVVTFRRQEALNGLLTRLRAAARIEKHI